MKYKCCSKQLLALSLVLSSAFMVSCAGVGGNSGDGTDSAITPVDIQQNLQKGDEALSRGAYDDAQVQYALAVKEQPGNSELLYKLAFVHYQKGTHNVAQELLARIIKQNNADGRVFEMLGLIALKGENLDKAEAHLLKALRLDSKRWRSLNAMGILSDLRSSHSEAQSYFQQASVLGADRAQIENNLGYSYYLEGKDALAIKHFRKATQLDVSYENAWANLGLAFVRVKQYEEARFAFEKVVDEATAANNLGYLAMLQGDANTANRELHNAIHLAPTHYAKANENLLIANRRAAEFTEPDLDNTNVVIQPASYRPLADTKQPLITQSLPLETNGLTTVSQDSIKTELPTKIVAAAVIPKVIKKTNRASPNRKSMATRSLYFLGYQSQADGGYVNELQRSAILSFQINNEIEPTGNLSDATLKQLNVVTNQRIQLYLDSLGFDTGSDNGGWNKQSRQALENFQAQQGLVSNGDVDLPTLVKLKSFME